MMKLAACAALVVAATLSSGCALSHRGSSSIDPVDAAQSVVLHVENRSPASVELRTVQQGRSDYIGSVGAQDVTDILLDRTIFPTATLYILGIPSGSQGRASVGPLAASKGATINFTIESAYAQSHATVVP